jgi:hypothetical protein
MTRVHSYAIEERAVMTAEDQRPGGEAPSGSGEKGAKEEKGVLMGMGEPSSFEPEEDPEAVENPEES